MRCILIVDDDEDIREIVADALEHEGYRVSTASDGSEALRMLQVDKLRPDVILLDMMMPVMDGWAFRAEMAKEPELSSIPIIVFTAHGVPKEIVQQLGAAGYLRKPARLPELLSAIERVRRTQAERAVTR